MSSKSNNNRTYLFQEIYKSPMKSSNTLWILKFSVSLTWSCKRRTTRQSWSTTLNRYLHHTRATLTTAWLADKVTLRYQLNKMKNWMKVLPLKRAMCSWTLLSFRTIIILGQPLPRPSLTATKRSARSPFPKLTYSFLTSTFPFPIPTLSPLQTSK